MKTLELNLKKKMLIVDLPIDAKNVYMSGNSIIYNSDKSCIVKPINDDYEFICKGSELTEEIASELVENKIKHKFENKVLTFYNYKNLELFISAVESKEKFWLENPIEKPKYYDKILTRNCLIWQEAEEKTFRNPLIFVKK